MGQKYSLGTMGTVRGDAEGWSPLSFVQSSANAKMYRTPARVSQNSRHLLNTFLKSLVTRNQIKCVNIWSLHFSVPHSTKFPQISNALFHFSPPSSPPDAIQPHLYCMNPHSDVKLIQKIRMDGSIPYSGLAPFRNMNHLQPSELHFCFNISRWVKV